MARSLDISLSYQWGPTPEERMIKIRTYGYDPNLIFHCPETNTFVFSGKSTLPESIWKYDNSHYLQVENHLIFFVYYGLGVFQTAASTKVIFPEQIRKAFRNFGFMDEIEMSIEDNAVEVRVSEKDMFLLMLRKNVL